MGHLLSLPSHGFLQHLFALLLSHSSLKHFQHRFSTLILFGGNCDADFARTSCAGLLIGNKTVICDGPATVLGQAESTSMLWCDGSRRSLPTSR